MQQHRNSPIDVLRNTLDGARQRERSCTWGGNQEKSGRVGAGISTEHAQEMQKALGSPSQQPSARV